MKWSLEADDYGHLFLTTMVDGVHNRKLIQVGSDVSAEPELIRAAAAETWTPDVLKAAEDRAAEVRREEAVRDERAAQEKRAAEAVLDAEFEARAARLGYVRKKA